jgi:hypothetical protein
MFGVESGVEAVVVKDGAKVFEFCADGDALSIHFDLSELDVVA